MRNFAYTNLLFHAAAHSLESVLTTLIEGVMAVDLSAMRKLYKDGALKAAIVSPAPMEIGAWVLTVERTDGSHEYMTVARKDRHKIYKSLESVSADAARVGFSEVKVVNLQVA
ncbi:MULTISPECIES: plasmid replication protein RepB [Pseudomonas]|nr:MULTISPECIES: plasmid replication protein RepB [Pseudomonas]